LSEDNKLPQKKSGSKMKPDGRGLMKRTIRNVAAGLGAAAIALACATSAGAQDYPTQRITFMVGFAAGGFADSVARIIGEHVSRTLGQTVLVENRGGAGSNIAARAVAIAPPDGYTVLVSTTALAINATLYKKLDYALVDDLIPVAIAVRAPETFSVSASKPQTLPKFIEAAGTAKLTFSSAGVGSGSHLTWVSFFNTSAKVDVVHVPFRGGEPATQAAVGGQVDGLAATASGSVVGQLTEGSLTCLAVAAAQRYPLLPNCPSLAELGYAGAEGSSWVGFWVPKGTPANVVAALNKAINSVTDNAKAMTNLRRNGDLPGLSVEAADKFVRSEVGSWAERVKISGAQAD
jgi:tripartite-type tricarboxylate transporter receptor subunit TctC